MSTIVNVSSSKFCLISKSDEFVPLKLGLAFISKSQALRLSSYIKSKPYSSNACLSFIITFWTLLKQCMIACCMLQKHEFTCSSEYLDNKYSFKFLKSHLPPPRSLLLFGLYFWIDAFVRCTYVFDISSLLYLLYVNLAKPLLYKYMVRGLNDVHNTYIL